MRNTRATDADVTVTVAFPHGATGTEEQGLGCVFANVAGLPALTVPAGSSGGRPIGLQIVGRRWSEIQLLDVAACLETSGTLPGFEPPDSGVYSAADNAFRG